MVRIVAMAGDTRRPCEGFSPARLSNNLPPNSVGGNGVYAVGPGKTFLVFRRCLMGIWQPVPRIPGPDPGPSCVGHRSFHAKGPGSALRLPGHTGGWNWAEHAPPVSATPIPRSAHVRASGVSPESLGDAGGSELFAGDPGSARWHDMPALAREHGEAANGEDVPEPPARRIRAR